MPNIDASALINDIIECVQEVSVLFYKGSSLNESDEEMPDFTKKVRDIYAKKMSERKSGEAEQTEEVNAYEDVWSENEEKEDALNMKYFDYSDYSDYLDKNGN